LREDVAPCDLLTATRSAVATHFHCMVKTRNLWPKARPALGETFTVAIQELCDDGSVHTEFVAKLPTVRAPKGSQTSPQDQTL
jgi:hypothetical protein